MIQSKLNQDKEGLAERKREKKSERNITNNNSSFLDFLNLVPFVVSHFR
jgi:hypothetical protein